ncbi:MAG: alpha/beta fold hydrolase [Candidatus Thorarchaeota archaeon]
MSENFAKIGDIKICYEILGEEDGYPILLIHGFGVKKEVWMAQVPDLSKQFKVIRFDNRGAGKSDRPAGTTMEKFADDTKKLLDFLKIEKTHVIGWSLGGMIAQHFVLKYPEKVNKLVLIATVHEYPTEEGPEIYKKMRLYELEIGAEKAFWETARANFYVTYRKEMEANPKKKFFGIWSAEDYIKMVSKDPPTPQDIINQAEALKTHHTLKRLKEIKNPTLLIAASNDRLTPKMSMEEMHREIPNSILIVIQKSAHFAPMTKTPEVNKPIIEFLKN